MNRSILTHVVYPESAIGHIVILRSEVNKGIFMFPDSDMYNSIDGFWIDRKQFSTGLVIQDATAPDSSFSKAYRILANGRIGWAWKRNFYVVGNL